MINIYFIFYFLTKFEWMTLFGDKKVSGFLLPAQKAEDGIGSQYHPNKL